MSKMDCSHVPTHPFEDAEFEFLLFPTLHGDGLGQSTIDGLGIGGTVQASEEEV